VAGFQPYQSNPGTFLYTVATSLLPISNERTRMRSAALNNRVDGLESSALIIVYINGRAIIAGPYRRDKGDTWVFI
jgi:hypothetical protein